MIIDIRGCNCAGKTTLLRSFVGNHEMIRDTSVKTVTLATFDEFSPTKKDPTRIVTHKITGMVTEYFYGSVCCIGGPNKQGKIEGMDQWSMKGVHDAFEMAIAAAAEKFDHVIYEGITVASTRGRYGKLGEYLVDKGFRVTWLLLKTDWEEAERRKLVRTPGKELKRDANGRSSIRDKAEAIPVAVEKAMVEYPKINYEILDHPTPQEAHSKVRGLFCAE